MLSFATAALALGKRVCMAHEHPVGVRESSGGFPGVSLVRGGLDPRPGYWRTTFTLKIGARASRSEQRHARGTQRNIAP